ncbi:MAG: hypothetical protein DME55_01350 [Verrucomicrobia bacterium]|nr:MAG: hypothetical protein DME55_01350 [Verrucomicrobiota bacterium]
MELWNIFRPALLGHFCDSASLIRLRMVTAAIERSRNGDGENSPINIPGSNPSGQYFQCLEASLGFCETDD